MVLPAGSVPAVNVTVRQSFEKVLDVLRRDAPANSAKLLALTVEVSMAFENVITTWVFRPAFAALLAGVTDTTVGGVVSVVLAVVKTKT